ncbi:AraC family transcriptional regulator [Nonomuraea sp. NPDC046570]|uniref:helix-turn-helix domain-containing protein n=1 Tax=Nonomuraea sp. NPDC046570 TaxID=3155255 RepID=UPI0033C19155
MHVTAARWGFGDVTSFSRAFRAAYGVNPMEYRQGGDARAGGCAERMSATWSPGRRSPGARRESMVFRDPS